MKNPFSKMFKVDRRKEYKKMQDKLGLNWYQDEIRRTENASRINMVVDIDDYLLREHKVLQRENFEFKEKTFETAKIVLQSIRMALDFHASYVAGLPLSFVGKQSMIEVMEGVYKKGQYAMIDYIIAMELLKHGEAWEYIYLKDKKIMSKIFRSSESYPCYDEKGNYYAFIEYWRDADSGAEYHTIYYPDRVEVYEENELVDTKENLTGLPIHYKGMTPSAYPQFGEPFVNDLIPILDQIELLLSRVMDGVYTLSTNPIAYQTGRSVVEDEPINANMVGACIRVDDGGQFGYANAEMDYSTIKLELDNLLSQFYAIACIPAAMFGQTNNANVSETSLGMLFYNSDIIGRKTMYSLKEGFVTRWEYMRKLLSLMGTEISDEEFDSIDCSFNINRPTDTQSAMNEMKMQRDMGAISIQTIIENSKHTANTALELERLQAEKQNTPNPSEPKEADSQNGNTDNKDIQEDKKV